MLQEDNHNNYNFHHVFASNPYNYGLSTKKSNGKYISFFKYFLKKQNIIVFKFVSIELVGLFIYILLT